MCQWGPTLLKLTGPRSCGGQCAKKVLQSHTIFYDESHPFSLHIYIYISIHPSIHPFIFCITLSAFGFLGMIQISLTSHSERPSGDHCVGRIQENTLIHTFVRMGQIGSCGEEIFPKLSVSSKQSRGIIASFNGSSRHQQ